MTTAGLSRKRVLVTGGSGVIGRELLQVLVKRGAEVLSLDRALPTWPLGVGVEHRTVDLAQDDLGFLRVFRPHAVIHLAAMFERTEESPEFWEPNWRDNVLGSHRLLEAIARFPALEVFVFASSYLVYDSHQYQFKRPPKVAIPLREDDSLRPRNLCGAAKLYTERELEFLGDRSAFRSVSARIFRVYGRGSRDVISRFIRLAQAGKRLAVYHPENRFDYVHARDVAEGLVRMAESERARGPINLATGRGGRVRQVLEVLERLAPRLIARTTQTREPYEASRADVNRLRRLVGWVPLTSLEEGIRDVWTFEEARG